MNQRKDILERKDDILKWISEGQTKAFMCKELSCKSETLNSYLKKFNIEYKGNPSHKGMKIHKSQPPIEVYLNNEKPIKTFKLKNKLLKLNMKDHKCEQCGLEQWQGLPIPLELHHIDGNHYNNELTNLQLLCPNCHALTDNYRGRGTKRHKEKMLYKNNSADMMEQQTCGT